MKIPNKIITDRLVIRCYDSNDAPLLIDAITNSLENLKQWMPWAKNEPTSLESKKELLTKFKLDFLQNIDYNFGLFNKHQDVLIGSAGLHTRIGPKSREIGYWINSKYLNQGYATECTRALIKVGFEYHGIENIQIRCDPNNVISQRIPEKLGFILIDVLESNTTTPNDDLRDTMIWNMTLDEYLKTKAAYPEINVYFREEG